MKGFVITLIIIVAIGLAISGIGFAIYGQDMISNMGNIEINNWDGFVGFGKYDEYSINQTETAPNENYDKINVKSVVADIEIVKWEEDEYKASFVGEIKTRSGEPKLYVSSNGNDLTFEIRYPKNSVNNFSSNLKLYVYIPENYNNSFSLKSVSGDIHLVNLNDLDNIDLSNVSGELDLSNIEGDKLSASTVSGDFNFNDIVFDTTTINSTSGDVVASGNLGSTNIHTISGKAKLTVEGSVKNTKIDTVSGDVKLYTDNDFAAKVYLKTVSGKLDVDIPASINESTKSKMSLSIGDNPNTTVEMVSVSGDLSIKTK